ncbi:enoyl-CoA-hydratase DpgD [Collimonas fungivorans]|uniref:enoyl-CoA-hydratase DpgD n=1 Tax=Collimonas fungivorans TaxID=158899 RepID=UPI0007788D94|nr:enoyl-CoA-hydratase DpgD [Collimonas fungivorans]
MPSNQSVTVDTTEPRVLYEKRGRVAHITLNRPNLLNAMDVRMHEELADIFDDFESDDDLWLAVLTGSGDRAFSVGQDLKELVARTAAGIRPSSFGSKGAPGWPRLTERFNLSKPIIARVNGFALGGGFELALACDIIVASDNSVFALPEAKLGLIAGAGGVFRLTRQLPMRTALGYLMTGRHFGAARAYELGLINDVVSKSQLDECVVGWTDDILRCAPLSVRSIKQVALVTRELPLPEAFDRSYQCEEVRRNSDDCREGPLAFVQKRPPQWKAR